MDFKKFTSQASSPTGGYLALSGYRGQFRGYELTSIKMEDADPIMKWRNEQIAYLHQNEPLTSTQQTEFFYERVKTQFSLSQPILILLRFTLENRLIGYSSLYDFNWQDLRAKAFFLLETERVQDAFQYGTDCSVLINLLMRIAFMTLSLNKMSMHSFDNRPFHVNAVEASGMRREGVLREHTKTEGNWVNVVVASCLRSEYLKQYPQ